MLPENSRNDASANARVLLRGALDGPPMVFVERGDYVESVHRVAACTVNAEGRILRSIGAVDVPVFVRSSIKPMIAAAVQRAAAAAGVALSDRELAVMSSSHNGEQLHVDAIAALLTRFEISPNELACGAAPSKCPDERFATPHPIYHNCSGKHAGILVLATIMKLPRAGYLDRSHPVTAIWLSMCERILGVSLREAPFGIDGCGLSVFAVSLAVLARGFAVLCDARTLDVSDRAAVERVRAAMVAEPEAVGGANHFDTRLLRAGGYLSKVGAEALQCGGDLLQATGFALKIIDGGVRARSHAVAAMLGAWGSMPRDIARVIAGEDVVLNSLGAAIGRISSPPAAWKVGIQEVADD